MNVCDVDESETAVVNRQDVLTTLCSQGRPISGALRPKRPALSAPSIACFPTLDPSGLTRLTVGHWGALAFPQNCIQANGSGSPCQA